jgi:hypothetical protein
VLAVPERGASGTIRCLKVRFLSASQQMPPVMLSEPVSGESSRIVSSCATKCARGAVNRPTRDRAPWEYPEEHRLKREFRDRLPLDQIAGAHGRTEAAISQALALAMAAEEYGARHPAILKPDIVLP